jgi:hypothetical protein
MNNDKILSLCVSAINHRGNYVLSRVADVTDENKLKPFFVDQSLPHGGENADTIFSNPSEVQPEGTITFWRWYSPDGYKTHSFIDRASISWIEYVRLNGVSSIEELRIAFFDGIDLELSSNRQYLIEFSRDDKICSCVYCKSSDFTPFGGKYTLCDNIYRLDYYEASSGDIYDIRTHLLPKINKRYYGHLELPQKSGTILVRTPADTVKQAIQKRIGRCTEGFSKSDKKVISDFVRNLSSDTIVKHIAEECRCSPEEAQEYIDEFARTCERYFSENDFVSSIMLHLVEYDSEVGQKYQEAVKEEWERQNAERISEATAEAQSVMETFESKRAMINIETEEAQRHLEELLIECDEYEKVKTETEAAVSQIQKEYDDKLRLADDIAHKVRTKIATAKSDLSSFLSEYALFLSEPSRPLAMVTGHNAIEFGEEITENPETITKMKELLECLKENLEAIGVEKAYGSSLGAYLLAAYFENIPLIIAGYGADLIADAVSVTVQNKKADSIHIVINDNAVSVDRSGSGILTVHSGFGNMARILNSYSSYVFFISQTSEELMIEPRSAYNYALPVFTEYFLTDNPKAELYGTMCGVQYNGDKKEKKPDFPEHILPLLAHKNCRRLLGAAAKIYSDITPYEISLLTTLPIMLSLNKRDELLDLLALLGLSDGEKSEIHKRIGEGQ